MGEVEEVLCPKFGAKVREEVVEEVVEEVAGAEMSFCSSWQS